MKILSTPSALLALAVLAGSPGEAWAACTPAAGNGVTATCTGMTASQNDPNGFGTGSETDLAVTVEEGASVGGPDAGIALGDGSVANSGTISAGVYGVTASAGDLTVNNLGTISSGVYGIHTAAGDLILSNSGLIAGDTFGVSTTGGGADVVNSGTISGGVFGISSSNGDAVVDNTATIYGAQYGVYATDGDATVTNSGTITGESSYGIYGSAIDVANSGTIFGGQYGAYATNGDATVTNSGAITGQSNFGVYGSSIDVENSGTIYGGQYGAFATNGDATVTNSGTITGLTTFGVFGNSIDVANSGTIFGGQYGAYATNGDATVTNSGTITGESTFGVFGSSVDVDNSGTIYGGNYGVYAGSGSATVRNSGTITGITAFGVFGNSSANVENSGTIGGGQYGVYASNGTATVTNSGIISGESYGISAVGADVTNSGTISGGRGIGTGGETAFVTNSGTIFGTTYAGIEGQTTELTNSGTITGALYGVTTFVGGSDVTNSGIISGGTAAIDLAGAGNRLTLLPGSWIVGAIDPGDDGTIDFEVGNQNLTFDTLAGATILSSVPYVVSGNEVVTVDPTSFALTDRTLLDFSGFVSSVVDGSFGAGGEGAAAAPALAYLPTDETDLAELSAVYADAPAMGARARYAGGLSVWGQGFAGRRWQQASGSLRDATTDYYGGLIGGDAEVAPGLRLGAFVGGGAIDTDIDPDLGHDESDLAFAGLYAEKALGATFLRGALQGGYTWNDTERRINNNLATGGLETAKGSYEGWYISPEATLGHVFALPGRASHFALTPSVKVRWLHAELDGYTESGSTANLTVADRSLDRFEERAELKASASDIALLGLTLGAEAHGGVLGQQRVGDDTVDTTLLGQGLSFATPGDDSVWGGYGGAGFSLGWGRATFGVTAEATFYSDDSQALAVHGGARIAF